MDIFFGICVGLCMLGVALVTITLSAVVAVMIWQEWKDSR
jgi:hypothetical protein